MKTYHVAYGRHYRELCSSSPWLLKVVIVPFLYVVVAAALAVPHTLSLDQEVVSTPSSVVPHFTAAPPLLSKGSC
ncbi:hypothetical protein E2C01_023276 [Portunus trituberculatus]|uniref:Uncharacterized protein n=1 Tax=Portunus trituberculatus TaxID=210409 RepID=A0A5B7E7K4_PORTR|nr:hypothetical protein [Portunus trituberculatus]